MDRRKIIITVLVIIAVVAVAYTYIINSKNNDFIGSGSRNSASSEQTTSSEQAASAAAVPGASESQDTPSETDAVAVTEASASASDSPQVIKTINIDVDRNSPEFDLSAALLEYSDQSGHLEFGYYVDGASSVKDFSEEDIPELKGLSKMDPVLLDAKYSKAYFSIPVEAGSVTERTAIYFFSIKTGEVEKLADLKGKADSLKLSPNGKHIAYSYRNPSIDSVHQENEMLDIVKCEDDSFLVRFSRNAKGKPIGSNRDPKLVYNFSLKAWKADTVLQLSQVAWNPSGKAADNKSKAVEVLYDLTKNLLLNTDGTPVAQAGAKEPAKSGSADSESLKILKTFYSYLPSQENYPKAMALLDDGFYLEMSILKQFGVDRVIKKDIDADSASLYGNILKTAKLDMVVKESIVKNTADIYYYQTLSLNADSQVKLALAMQLQKTAAGWRITSIRDADPTKAPFVNYIEHEKDITLLSFSCFNYLILNRFSTL